MVAPKSPDENRFDLDSFLRAGALLALPDGTLRVGCGPRPAARPDTHGGSLYAPDFFLDGDEPWMVFERTFTLRRDRLCEMLRRVRRAAWDVIESTPPSRSLFTRAIEDIREGFREGRWAKVVPYAVAETRTTTGPAQIARAILRLLDHPAPLTPYGFWSGDEGMLGASPELLLRKDGWRVTSVAMAGTRARGSGKASLRSDAKQLGEHGAVLRDIESRLRALGRVDTRPIRTVEIASLQHLSAEISAGLREETGFEDLVRILHPTPALGASPRGSADEFLRDLDEKMPRWRFGAPFGWRLASEDGLCVVAIRNVQWRGDRLRLATGCGIVPASRVEDEWAELQAKQAAVRDLIGLVG
jgi:menaquinone-specific isochorismate synthase